MKKQAGIGQIRSRPGPSLQQLSRSYLFIRIPSAFRFLSVRKTLAARIGGVQELM